MKQLPCFSLLALLLTGLLLLTGCVSPAMPSSAGTLALSATAAEAPVSTSVPPAAMSSNTSIALPRPGGTDSATLAAAAEVVASTVEPAGSAALPVGTGTTPLPPLEISEGSPVVVTLADTGRTITMHVGDRFLLNLDGGASWAVEIADPAVLSPVEGVPAAEGSQGLFETRSAGSTTFTATDDPPCRKARPPCMLPTRAFEITVVVV